MEQSKLDRINQLARLKKQRPRRQNNAVAPFCRASTAKSADSIVLPYQNQSQCFGFERRQSGMNELSALAGSERMELLPMRRQGARAVLENTYIVTPDGKKHKLPRRDGGQRK